MKFETISWLTETATSIIAPIERASWDNIRWASSERGERLTTVNRPQCSRCLRLNRNPLTVDPSPRVEETGSGKE